MSTLKSKLSNMIRGNTFTYIIVDELASAPTEAKTTTERSLVTDTTQAYRRIQKLPLLSHNITKRAYLHERPGTLRKTYIRKPR